MTTHTTSDTKTAAERFVFWLVTAADYLFYRERFVPEERKHLFDDLTPRTLIRNGWAVRLAVDTAGHGEPVAAGFLVRGNVISGLFNATGEPGLGALGLVTAVLDHGVRELQLYYNGDLFDYYKRFGFVSLLYEPFGNYPKPLRWDEEKHGRPSVVTMAIDPDDVDLLRRGEELFGREKLAYRLYRLGFSVLKINVESAEQERREQAAEERSERAYPPSDMLAPSDSEIADVLDRAYGKSLFGPEDLAAIYSSPPEPAGDPYLTEGLDAAADAAEDADAAEPDAPATEDTSDLPDVRPAQSGLWRIRLCLHNGLVFDGRDLLTEAAAEDMIASLEENEDVATALMQSVGAHYVVR